MVKIKKIVTNFTGKIFSVKTAELIFTKTKALHEYISPNGKQSVEVVAIDSKNNVVLVEMYATAMRKRELFCPGGLVDKGETALQAARRECQEEIGYLPKKLIYLASVETSPGYIEHTTHIYLGINLEKSKLKGDEPQEDLKTVKIPLKKIQTLIKKKKLLHASSIAAILLAEKYLTKH